MNTISVAGKLRGTPKVKKFDNFCVLSGVITDYGSASYMKDGEKKVGAIFHNFDLKGSENKIQFFEDMYEEGLPVTLSGTLSQRPYSKDGEERIWQSIDVSQFTFHVEKDHKPSPGKPKTSSSSSPKSTLDEDDPFADE